MPNGSTEELQAINTLVDISEQLKILFEKNRALEAVYELNKILLSSFDFKEMVQKIADLIPQKFNYETGVLALINDSNKTLERVAISKTSGGTAALESLQIPFEKIVIPLDYKENLCIKALDDRRQYATGTLHDVLRPAISEENSLEVQRKMGTRISIINPLYSHDKPIGVFIVSMSKTQDELTAFEKELIKKFSESVGIAVENARMFEDLKKAYLELKEIDKQKDDFIAVTSHELRTPATIIKNYIWMLDEGKAGELTDKQKEYLNKAMNGTERMINLVTDILNLSEIEHGKIKLKIEKIAIKNLLIQCVEEFKLTATGKQLYLTTEIPDDIKDVYGDIKRIQEVVTNIISNAIKFTGTGGITVSARNIDDNFVSISIKDTGKGIAQMNLERLFHKFGRLDNSYQTVAEAGGTGLGLYISKILVEAMGGEISATSPGEGKGTTFCFTLPIKPGMEKKSFHIDLCLDK